MHDSPVRYSPDIEVMQADEALVIEQLNATFDTIFERTAADYGHAVRSVHAKAARHPERHHDNRGGSFA